MFEQEENVADFSLFAQGDQLLLEAEACRVIYGAELDDLNHSLSRITVACRAFAYAPR